MEKENHLFDEIKITKIWNQDMGKFGNFNLSKDQRLIKVNFLFDAIKDKITFTELNGYVWIQREDNYFELAKKLLYDGSVIENVEFYKKKTEKGYEHYKLDFKTTDEIVYEEADVKNILDNIGTFKQPTRISTFKK